MLSTWVHSLCLWARKNWMYHSRLTPAQEIKTTLGPEPSRRTKSTHVHFKNTARGKQKPRGVCSCTYDVTGNTCQHGSMLTSHDIDPLPLPNSAPPGLTPQYNAAVLQGLCDSQEQSYNFYRRKTVNYIVSWTRRVGGGINMQGDYHTNL